MELVEEIAPYHGHGSTSNISSLVDIMEPQTNQVAEVTAAIVALQDVQSSAYPWVADEERCCKLFIMTYSKYLVDAISDWIYRWKTNGWRTSKNGRVANRELFEKLDDLMSEFEENNIPVCFWHVGRNNNHDADRLTNEALVSL
jgi:ribonuclease HI